MSDGNLTQSLECVDGNDFIAWNDTVDNCQRNYITIATLSTYLLTYLLASCGPLGACLTSNSNFVLFTSRPKKSIISIF